MQGSIALSLLQLCYLLYERPLGDWELMFCEIFNEICILCIAVSMTIFDEYGVTEDQT